MEKQLPVLGKYFDGKYSDFDAQWYVVIGAQVVLNSLGDLVGPAISHYLDRIILSIEMCFDQRKCCKKKRYPTA